MHLTSLTLYGCHLNKKDASLTVFSVKQHVASTISDMGTVSLCPVYCAVNLTAMQSGCIIIVFQLLPQIAYLRESKLKKIVEKFLFSLTQKKQTLTHGSI